MASDSDSGPRCDHHGCAHVSAASDSANNTSTTSRCPRSERRELRSSHAQNAHPSALKALREAIPLRPASRAPRHAQRSRHGPLRFILSLLEYLKTSTASAVPFISGYRELASPNAERLIRNCIAEATCQLSLGMNRMNDHADVARP